MLHACRRITEITITVLYKSMLIVITIYQVIRWLRFELETMESYDRNRLRKGRKKDKA